MAERKSIAIIYTNDENWIGGTYYIQNLVAAFLKLREEEKPSVLLLSKTKEEFEQVAKSGYPFLTWQPLEYEGPGLPLVKRIFNKVAKMLSGYDRSVSRKNAQAKGGYFPKNIKRLTELLGLHFMETIGR